MDASSCGVFVCKFARAFLFNPKAFFFQVGSRDIDRYRKEIWQILTKAADNAKDLCHCCGEVDVPNDAGSGKANTWVKLL